MLGALVICASAVVVEFGIDVEEGAKAVVRGTSSEEAAATENSIAALRKERRRIVGVKMRTGGKKEVGYLDEAGR